MQGQYNQSRFYYAPDEWPPYHPKHYTTLALIHHKGRHANTEVITVTQELVTKGTIGKKLPQSGTTTYQSKNISELFPTNLVSSYFVLIEGAPGIGKTVLCKEIVYQWANKTLLKSKQLVFLFLLRDPNLRKVVSLENLMQYLLNINKISSDLSEYLFQTKGKGVTIIFDGYDEMSEADKNNSLVAKIIRRDVLPECDIVVTSRPTASLHFRDMADCRVEVLGFTEEDRLDYIQHALEGSDDKVKVLQTYLQSNSTINALCYVPLNMTILLSLFEELNTLSSNSSSDASMQEVRLPSTQTEMYETFILRTVTRFIKKNDKSFSGKCFKISDLPAKYSEIYNELLALAYFALVKDQIVFSLDDEVLQACPILRSGNCEGLGLLKVTEFISNVSFHFLHFSVQEYLAAYYIASQSSTFQVQLLKDTFWNIRYFNTWIMYVGITGGKRLAWKHFISDNRFILFTKIFKSSKISKSFLNDKIKSLHLFQCFAEIGNNEIVGIIFRDKVIDLSNQTLLPKDIDTLCFFLLRSVNKQWKMLDLSNCNIGDTGSDILCNTFLDQSRYIVSIEKVNLSHNQLQSQSVLRLFDVLNLWHTSEVIFSESCDSYADAFELYLNKFSQYIDESFSQMVLVGPYLYAYNIDLKLVNHQLVNSTHITGLYLNDCYYSRKSVFESISNNQNISKLHIIGQNLRVDFTISVIQKINEVDSVYIYDHTLSDEDVNYYSSLILYKLNPRNPGTWIVIGSTRIIGNILILKEKFSPLELFNLAESIKRLCSSSSMATAKFSKYNSISIFKDLCTVMHKNVFKCEITFCMVENNLLIANGVNCDTIIKELSFNDQLNSVFIRNCGLLTTDIEGFISLIRTQKSLNKLYIYHSLLEMNCFKILCTSLLNQITGLRELLVHSNDSSCIITSDLLVLLRNCSDISILLLNNSTLVTQNPTDEQMSLSLSLETDIRRWRIQTYFNINLMDQVKSTFFNVVALDIVDWNLTHCDFQDSNYPYFNHERYTTSINQGFNNLAKFLSFFSKLENLNLSDNDIQGANASKIFKNSNISTLTKLDISHNGINEQTADDIVYFLSGSPELEELDISYNRLQANGTIKIMNGLNILFNLKRLNISHNDIDDRAADSIAAFLSHNAKLQELDLSHNNFQAVIFLKEVKSLMNLTQLNVRSNIISEVSHDMSAVSFQSNLLEELDLSYNDMMKSDALKCFFGMKNLTKLCICSIGMNVFLANDIITILNNNIQLKEFDLSHNNLGSTCIIMILKNITQLSMNKFNISHNNINDEAADYIANFLSNSTELHELDLSYNQLQAAGIIQICRTNISKMVKFNISNNNITAEAADDIAAFLSLNSGLQVLDLSYNELQEHGWKNIFKAAQSICDLSALKLSDINIPGKTADELTAFLLYSTQLKEIDISNTNLSVLDAIKIFKGMRNISNLLTLSISHNIINDEVVDELATVLYHNTSLKHLYFSYNDLSSLSTIKIFQGMKNISKLETIDISHNMITDEAAEAIATVLSHNNKLESLDLSYNYFGCEGFAKMFGYSRNIKHLMRLSISSNTITIKAAESIATFMFHISKLEEFDLSNNFMQTAAAIKIFKSMTNIFGLRKMHIHNNMITDEAADYIAILLSQNTKLEDLDISCNNLQTDGAIKILHSIKSTLTLRKLNVSHNVITDEAMKYIEDVMSGCKRLEELNMSYINLKIPITFTNLNITSLVKFDFSHNNIDEQTANEISLFLSCCTKLRILNLSYTNLQTAGGIRLLNELDIYYLTKFNISGNDLTTDTADNVATLLSKNDELEELDLSCNNLQEVGTKSILDFLNISNLTKLNVSNNNIMSFSNYLLDILTHATNLVQLDLSYNKLTSDKIEHFLNKCKNVLVNLKKLNLSGNEICNGAATALENVLSDNNTLQELSLSNTNLRREEISKLFSKLCLPYLTKLSISHNTITDEAADDIATFLSKCNKLEVLDLSHNHLTSAGAIKICKTNLTCLAVFNLNFNDITAEAANDMAALLSQNLELQVIDLSNNDLQECGYSNIFGVLKCMSVLSTLTLCNSNIINKVADELAAVLYHNTLLQELDLSYNDMSTSDVIKIFNGMKNINNLITLNISHNTITDEAAEAIEAVLSHNNKLRSLNLSYNYFISEGFIKIFSGIKNITYLQKFNISRNKITGNSAVNIAVFLSHNLKLEELDLSNNFLQTTSTITIFKGLKTISTLKKVYIHNNEITCKAADSIAAFLFQCTKLEEFDVSYNYIQARGAKIILEGLKCISNLTKFNIAHNLVNDEAIDCIVNVLHNSKMKELNLSCNDLTSLGALNLVNLTKFSFSHSNFNMQTAKEMNRFLSHCVNLQELDLSHNNLRTAIDLEVFYGLNVSSLTKLNICGNLIPSHATCRIAAFLSNSKQLEELDISYNDLQELGIITILNSVCVSNLTKLNISSNNITTSIVNIAHVLTNATKLAYIDLSYNDFIVDSDFINNLSSFVSFNFDIFISMETLHISGNVYAAVTLAFILPSNSKLKELNFSNNHLDAEIIIWIFSQLHEVSTLIKLNISHNNITDEAADDIAIFLSRNTKLEELDLSHNILTASGAMKIFNVNISKLKKINISHNNITAQAADNIQAFICRNTKLEELDLSHNQLQTTGAIKICKSLLLKLHKFNISHNNISVKATNDIAGFLCNAIRLQVLDLSYNYLQESGCRSIFKGLQHTCALSSVKLSNNGIINEAIDGLVTVLLQNNSLQEIDLSGNDLSTYDARIIFKAMENISTLLTINISHNMISDEAACSIAAVLSHNNNLQTLNISFNCFTSNGCIEIFNGMINMSNLRNLNVSYNKITSEVASNIVSVLSQNVKLEELDTSYNYLQASGAIKILQGIKNNLTLTKLDIAHNMITDEATEYVLDILSINGPLKELNLSHNSLLETDVITKAMSAYATKMLNEQAVSRLSLIITSLRELDLSDINLQTSGVVRGFKGIDNISTLIKFNISRNSITSLAATVLAEFLSNNSNLQELDMSHNDLQETGMNIILSVIKFSYLFVLNISANNINLKAIGEMLSHATKLMELDLSYNRLQDSVDATCFFTVTKNVLVNLSKLDISDNCHYLDDECAETLSNIFTENTQLKELNLSDNNLHSKVILSKILSGLNPFNVTNFNISHNYITDDAADDIACFLSKCPKLEELDISHNNLKSPDVMKICKTGISKLTSFNMSHNDLTIEAVDELAALLSLNAELQILEISYTDLQEVEFIHIFKEMKILFHLSVLKISNGNVNNKAADELASILCHNVSLKELDLSYNDLSTSDVIKIFNGMKNINNLITLNISHNTITDEAAEAIETVFSHNNKIQSLDLSYNCFISEGFFKFFSRIRNITHLQKLSIGCNKITGNSAETIAVFLSHNLKLEELDLSNNFLQTTSAITIFEALKTISTLKKVYVHNNEITCKAADSIAAFLFQCTKLEEFDVSYNNLQTIGAMKIFAALKCISNLTKFNIAHNMITDEAIEYIAEVLFYNSKLRELNLSYNYINSICGLENHLTIFNFSRNTINKQTVNELSQFLSNNASLEELDLSYTNLQTAGGLEVFDGLNVSSLTKLNICGNLIPSHAAGRIAAFLSNNKQLKELDMSCNDLQESGMITILNSVCISNLTKLNISSNNITTSLVNIADVLTNATRLIQINLSCNNFIINYDDRLLNSMSKNIFQNVKVLIISCISGNATAAIALTGILQSNSKLTELDLSNNHLLAKGITQIFSVLKVSTLIKLNISRNNITDEAADDIAIFLSRNTKLEELDLSHNILTASGAMKIFNVNISRLKKINISHNNITAQAADNIQAFICRNTRLEELDLSHNNLQATGAIKICKSMLLKLHKFNISHNNVSVEAANDIAGFLCNAIRLQVLDLSFNDLQESGCRSAFKGLEHTCVLSSVKLSNNGVINEAIDGLVTVLLHNNLLQEIDLSGNDLSTYDARIIFKAMESISTLLTIDISHNMISDEAACSIAAVLSHNNNLQTLNISFNCFTSNGCIEIFNGMNNMSNLRNLNVSYNKITSEVASNIVSVLSQNVKLEELDISYNYLQASSTIKILQGIKDNLTLTKLDIAHNMITDEATEYVLDILSINGPLKELNLSHNSLLETDLISKAMSAYATKMLNEQAFSRLSLIITSLRELDLSDINLQTSGVVRGFKGVDNITTLTKFNISRNSITPLAATVLAEFLSNNSNLQVLDMSHNDLQETGINIILSVIKFSHLFLLNISANNINLKAIGEMLSHATKLVELDLSYNRLQDSVDATCFFTVTKNVLVNLSKLNISDNCHYLDDECAETLSNIFTENTQLKELNLSNNNLHSKVILSKILNGLNPFNVTNFNISHNHITDDAADDIACFLSKCPKLEELDISHNNLKSPDVMKIYKTGVSKLTSFNMSHNDLTIEAVDELAVLLSLNVELQILEISYTNLQEVGFIHIFKEMKNFFHLSVLKISNGNVNNKAADELASILCHNVSLQELDLSYNDLSTSDAIKIFNGMKNINNLITLNISHNTITDEAVEAIETVFSHNNKIQSIDLSYNYFTSEGFFNFFSRIRNITHLQKLSIGCNKITVNSAESIAVFLSHNLKLEELDLSNNFLQTTSAIIIFEALKTISSLKKVYVHINEITCKAADSIAAFLFQCTKLEEFDVSYNNLQTIGAMKIFAALKCISNLTKFNIAHNMITDEAIEYIAEVLFYNSKLRELNLSYNYINSICALENHLIIFNFSSNTINKQTVSELSQFLSNNASLEELDLSYTNLQTAGGLEVFDGLNVSSLTKLNICGNLIPSHAAGRIAAFLSNNKQLKELDMSCNDLQESGMITILNSVCISNLTKLNISSNNITTSLVNIADVLINATRLIQINLSCNNFIINYDDRLLNSMSKNIFQSVKVLIISCISGNATAAIALTGILQSNSKLTELDLSNNHLLAKGITQIFSVLKVSILIKLNISRNNITDEAADDIAIFLSRNTKLEELDLSHNILTASGAMKIFNVNISRLKKINISHNNITAQAADNIQAFICRNTRLEELDLSHNNLQATGAIKICKSMLLKLHKFNISHNNISVEAANDIAGFLCNAIRLQVLDLSFNDLQESGCRSAFKGLEHTCVLSSVKLSNNGVINEAIDGLVTVLFHNNLLQEIDLSGNDLSTYDARIIFKAMENISTLLTINISHNMISDEAACSIAAVLHHNNNLQTLNISFNCFSSDGCIKIFNGMNNMSYLKKLNISYSKITSEVASNIVSVLSQNMNLEELDISYNYLQASGAIKILQGIKDNLTLTKLDIAHNMITDEATECVLNILSIYGPLKELNLSHNSLLETDVISNAMSAYATKMLNEQAVSRLSLIITSLRELDLSDINLQTSGVVRSFKGVDNITTLTKFNISRNSITSLAATVLAEFLSNNSNLQELDMSHNDLQETGVSEILGALKNFNVTSLNISANNANLKSIGEVLSQTTKFVELDLSYNVLKNSIDAECFFTSIKCVFVNLIKLNMSGICYEIHDDAATALADAFSESTQLKELNLSSNNLHSEAISIILSKLNLSTLIKLNISHNNVNDKTANDIEFFLSNCTKLAVFDISHNGLQDTSIAKILKANISSLVSFNVSHNNITYNLVDDITNFLSQNLLLDTFDLSCNKGLLGITNCFNQMQKILNFCVLDMSNNNLSDELVDELTTVLANTAVLKEFNLSHNNLSTSNAIKIFKRIKDASNLETINISHNMITDEAADDIATVLSRNNNLETLDLSYNLLGSKGCDEIFKRSSNIVLLRQFNISFNEFTAQAADSIASFLSQNLQLDKLDLSNNFLQTKCVISVLNSMENIIKLTSINLCNMGITDGAAENIGTFLSQNTMLEKLDISCNNLQAAGTIKMFTKMSNISNLKELNISSNEITAKAATNIGIFLSQNSMLEKLNVSCNNLRAVGISEIFTKTNNISSLRELNICDNLITDEAADDIASFLSLNNELADLVISFKHMQAAGTIKILQSVKHIPTLNKLHVTHNMFANEALVATLSENVKLKVLYLGQNYLQNLHAFRDIKITSLTKFTFTNNIVDKQVAITHDIPDFLSSCKRLQELDLSYSDLQNTDAIKSLNRLPLYNLIKFNIRGNSLTMQAADYVAAFLRRNDQLNDLDLSYNNLEESGTIKILKATNFSNLANLNISNNNIGGEASNLKCMADMLTHASNLTEVNLSDNKLRAAKAIYFFTKLRFSPKLVKLDISKNSIGDIAAKDLAYTLSSCINLQELDLSDNDLHSTGISDLFRKLKISNLTKFAVNHNKISDQAANDIGYFLSRNVNLKELDLSCTSLNDTGVKNIFKHMVSISKLFKLNISENRFTHNAADDIATFLLHNIELKEIDLSSNDLVAAGAITIFQGMKNVMRLEKVNINYIGITPEAVSDIATILSHNLKLKELRLANNNIQASGISKLFYSMTSILHLTCLDICLNKATSEAVDDIINLLAYNHKLEELDLSSNSIQATGAAKIFEKIKTNLNLKKLNVSSNEITDETADVIAQFVEQNLRLEELDLSYNKLQTEGAVKIFQAISSHSNLRKLNMYKNMITDEASDDIIVVLSRVAKLLEVDLDCNEISTNAAYYVMDKLSSNAKLLLRI